METFIQIKTFDGLRLQATVLNREAAKWVIVTHGVGEHSGRHQYWLGEDFKDFNIFLYDLRGHGRSQGPRGNVNNFDDYLRDVDTITDFLANDYNMKDFVLFGHSMGGLIIARWIQKRKDRAHYPTKIILSAPGAGTVGILGLITNNIPGKIYASLAKLPSLPLGGMLDLTKLSHNPHVYKDYVNDPLNILKIHSHLYFDLLNKASDTFNRPLNARSPLLVVMGGADGVVSTKLVKKFFEKHERKAKLVLIKDAYHELYKESEVYFAVFIREIKSFLGV